MNDSKGNNYITCENNTFKLSRSFNFAEYVDPAWDESINCNNFSDSSVEKRVNIVLQALESKTGRSFNCPIERDNVKILPIQNIQMKKNI